MALVFCIFSIFSMFANQQRMDVGGRPCRYWASQGIDASRRLVSLEGELAMLQEW
jgi:hypothetical protein